MLGRFLGRGSQSDIPKNQIEITCPACGAVQREPRLVVTTFCKKCGEHLRIEKKKAIASSQSNPVPSAVFPFHQERKEVAKQPPQPPVAPATPSPAPVARIPAQTPPTASALLPTTSDDEEDIPLGLGQMMGIEEEEELITPSAPLPDFEESVDEPTFEATPEIEEEQIVAEQPFEEVVETPPAPPPAPILPPRPNTPFQAQTPVAPSTTFQRMREQGLQQQYFKEIECFECSHKFKVGRSAKTANCPSCGSSLCLEDFDINLPTTTPIRTRGDVHVRKTGNISTSTIRCRDLRIHGTVSAQIDCSGDLIIKTSGTIVGEVHCHRLIVEKGSDIHFLNVVYANEVEVQARVYATIHCNGLVKITPTGFVHGDVTARSVAIEPGGQLDGGMNILRPAPKPVAKAPSEAENTESEAPAEE